MANNKNTDKAAQTNAAAASSNETNDTQTNDTQTNARVSGNDVIAEDRPTHVALHTIQSFDPKINNVVEVKAGALFTPNPEDVEVLERNNAIREATDDDFAREGGQASNGVVNSEVPAGYAANTHTGISMYAGGVSNPNDSIANTPEGAEATDAAFDGAPTTSVSRAR